MTTETELIATLFHLGLCDSLQSWQAAFAWQTRLRSVTAADIQRVVKRYFNSDNRVVGIATARFRLPKPIAPPAPPADKEGTKSEKNEKARRPVAEEKNKKAESKKSEKNSDKKSVGKKGKKEKRIKRKERQERENTQNLKRHPKRKQNLRNPNRRRARNPLKKPLCRFHSELFQHRLAHGSAKPKSMDTVASVT